MPERKRPRRQYGTGGLYQRASDGRWVGKIPAGWTATGTRRYIHVTAKTEAEAKRKLRDKQTEIAKAGLPPEGAGRPTVKSWSTTWLPLHAQAVAPNTYTTDRGAIRKWIIPTIGHHRLDTLTPRDVRAIRTAITDAGLSSTTARQAHWTLMGMLKAARQEGHRVPDNVLEVSAPPRAVNDREAIPVDAAMLLLDTAAQDPNGARWVAALLEGMRQGERVGLTWDAINFEADEIDVSWQLQSLAYLDPKNKQLGFRIPDGYEARHLTHAYHLVRPKTDAGRRIIPMVPWLASALQAWHQAAPDNPWGLVWCDVDERNNRTRPTPYRGHTDRDDWRDLQARAKVAHPSGRPYTMHEARNTTATLLFEAGVDAKTITQILGHASIITSRGYQTVSRAAMREAMEKVAARLGIEPPTPGNAPAE